MAKYHITDKGRVERCTAFFRKCPYHIHGTQEECQAHIDREYAEKERIENEKEEAFQKGMADTSNKIYDYYGEFIAPKIYNSDEYKNLFFSFVGNDFGKPRGIFHHRNPKPGIERLACRSDDFRSHYRTLSEIGNIEYEVISDLAVLGEISQEYPDVLCRFRDTAIAQLKRTKLYYELAREMGISDDKIKFYSVDEYTDPNLLKNVRRNSTGEIDNLYFIAEEYGNIGDYLNENITPVQSKVIDIRRNEIKTEDDFEFKNYAYFARVKSRDYQKTGGFYHPSQEYIKRVKKIIFAVTNSDLKNTKPLTEEEMSYKLANTSYVDPIVYDEYIEPATMKDKTSIEYRDRAMNEQPYSIQYSVPIPEFVKTLNREYGEERLTSTIHRNTYIPIFHGPFEHSNHTPKEEIAEDMRERKREANRILREKEYWEEYRKIQML